MSFESEVETYLQMYSKSKKLHCQEMESKINQYQMYDFTSGCWPERYITEQDIDKKNTFWKCIILTELSGKVEEWFNSEPLNRISSQFEV